MSPVPPPPRPASADYRPSAALRSPLRRRPPHSGSSPASPDAKPLPTRPPRPRPSNTCIAHLAAAVVLIACAIALPALAQSPSPTASASVSVSVPTPVPCTQAGAEYTITFNFNWTRNTDTSFPDKEPEVTPGFTQLLCVTHNQNFSLGELNKLLPEFLRLYFEEGQGAENALSEARTIQLDSSLGRFNDSSSVTVTESQRQSVFRYEFGERGFVQSVGASSITIPARSARNQTMVSCFTRVWPAADWFTGLSGIALCVDGSFQEEIGEQRLTNLDGGIFNSDEYTPDEQPKLESPLPVARILDVAPGGFGFASIKRADITPSPSASPQPSSPACFPADEPVLRADGTLTPVQDLMVGDDLHAVLPSPLPRSPERRSNQGRILAFSHNDRLAFSSFVKLSFRSPVDAPGAIRLSPGHLIMRHHQNQSGFSLPPGKAMDTVPAYSVLIGDALVCTDGSRCVVTAKTFVRAPGLFNPHPVSGQLVVSGVWVSAYTTAVDQLTATALLAPPRALVRLGMPAVLQPTVDLLCWVGRCLIQAQSTGLGTGR